MKNVLVSGATGFIGSFFIENNKSKYNIKTFSFRSDSIDSLVLSEIETILHLSALVHQMNGVNQEEYERVNVTQTVALAKKAKKNGVKHFIFMSTVKVYGEETDIAYTEDSVCKPQDDYGKSKLKAEIELLKLQNDDFKISIIRTPIVYGYGVKANIKNLINLVNKISILPFGDIQNKRSMVFVGNLCHLMDEIIIQEKQGVFLASDDEPISTTKLCELIAKELCKKIYLIKIPFFETFLKYLKPSFYKRLYRNLEIDNNKTKKILNYQNKYSIEEGIKLMIKGEK